MITTVGVLLDNKAASLNSSVGLCFMQQDSTRQVVAKVLRVHNPVAIDRIEYSYVDLNPTSPEIGVKWRFHKDGPLFESETFEEIYPVHVDCAVYDAYRTQIQMWQVQKLLERK